MRIFNLLFVCLLCTTLLSAQNKDRAAEMITALEKHKVDKEAYLSKIEKQIVDIAAKDKNVNLKTVSIDRKTGIISATVIDGKGQERAMDGSELLTKLNDGASSDKTNAHSASMSHSVSYDCSGCFLPEWLCYHLGLCREIITYNPHAPLTPEEKRKIDEDRIMNELPPIYSGQY